MDAAATIQDYTSEEEEEEDEEPALKYERLQTGPLLEKDNASALAVSDRYLVVGTHQGSLAVLDFQGRTVKHFSPHFASVLNVDIDVTSEFVASASIDGKVFIASLSTDEQSVHDLGRPARCVALEPEFAKRKVRQFATGGMAGILTLHEKGWLGQKDTSLHSGEGPIWAITWRTTLIAWANDEGVRIYDTRSTQKIAHIPQDTDAPRPDLFKYTLAWKDDRTMLISQANYIRIVSIKERDRPRSVVGTSTQLYAEVTAVFQVDCMISGICHFNDAFLIVAYATEETFQDEATDDFERQRRQQGLRPELRIISKEGEELSADELSLDNFERYQCNSYSLAASSSGDAFYVVSPKDLVVARARDAFDHITWLVERGNYQDALQAAERLSTKEKAKVDVRDIGIRYLQHLIEERDFSTAAQNCPSILASDFKAWEDYIFLFIEKGQIQTIIPYVPTKDPQLSRMVYEMMLAHFLRSSPKTLLKTIRIWPSDIYDAATIISAVEGALLQSTEPETLKDCLADLYIINRQPGKALPYYLELRRPGAFDLIREYNLFTSIQDRVVQLVEFDQDILKREGKQRARDETEPVSKSKHGAAIDLLAEHSHSIPIPRVLDQLKNHRRYLYMYLDTLYDKDPHLAPEYADLQVDLYAEFEPDKLMEFWKATSSYSLEKAYEICLQRDLVREQVFLLARMGNSKKALALIIERVGDVQRAIDFAKEQNEDDLWEDLLKYSETRPPFIKGLLQSVGSDIDPIRLIRRIQNGLEIPGLRDALIKILQDYNLQISLIEGCESILQSDCRQLSMRLHRGQTTAFHGNSDSVCYSCRKPLYPSSYANLASGQGVILLFLCRHIMHAGCAFPSVEAVLPSRPEHVLAADSLLQVSSNNRSNPVDLFDRQFRSKMRFVAELRSKVAVRCHVCEHKSGGSLDLHST